MDLCPGPKLEVVRGSEHLCGVPILQPRVLKPRVLPPPLRTLQIRHGLWVRNGDELLRLEYFYNSHYW